MKIRFAIVESFHEKRISFSNEELLYMINSLGDSDHEEGVKMVLEQFLKELNGD